MIEPPTQMQAKSVGDSDSDSDWDDDDDFGGKKINIKIKPINQGGPGKISASVDELRATVGNWKSLANVNLVKPNSRRHHRSTLQLNGSSNEPRDALTPPTVSSTILPARVDFPDDLGMNQTHTGARNNTTLNNNLLIYHNDMSNLSNYEQIRENSQAIQSLSNDLQNSKLHGVDSSMLSREQIPVAFAVQECLNVMCLGESDPKQVSSIVGHIKMAVPLSLVGQDLSCYPALCVSVRSDRKWSKIKLNEKLVEDTGTWSNNLKLSRDTLHLSIDLNSVQSYASKHIENNRSDKKYILLPELVRYVIESDSTTSESTMNPLVVSAHQLCEQSVTKMRLDIRPADLLKDNNRLTPDDIKDLRVTLRLNGSILSQQSRPEAEWNPSQSELVWNFASLSSLIQEPNAKNSVSFLARFTSAQVSRVEEIKLQFSIHAKTISGTQVTIDDTQNFMLAKQKLEVRTGTYKCESQPL